MGQYFKRNGFTDFKDLMRSVVNDMVASGFNLVYADTDPVIEILQDTITIKKDGVELTPDVDYVTPIRVNANNSLTVELTSAPAAGEQITGSFTYTDIPETKTFVLSNEKTNGPSSLFVYNADSVTAGYSYSSSTLTVIQDGNVFDLDEANTDYSVAINNGFLEFNIQADLLPKVAFNVKAAPIIVQDELAVNGLYTTQNAVATWDNDNSKLIIDVPYYPGSTLNKITAETTLEQFIQTFSGINYVSVKHTGGTLTLDPATGTSSISEDLTTLTVEFDYADLGAVVEGDVTSISCRATPLTRMKKTFSEEDLVGDKSGYTDSFSFPQEDGEILPGTVEIYIRDSEGTETLKTLGLDYHLKIENNSIKISFYSGSVPSSDDFVLATYDYEPYRYPSDLIAAGVTDGVNTEFLLNPVLLGNQFVLEAGPQVDPLSETQPWRVYIDAAMDEPVRLKKIVRNTTGEPTSTSVRDGKITLQATDYGGSNIDGDHFEVWINDVRSYGQIAVGTEKQIRNDGTLATSYLQETYIDKYGRGFNELSPGLITTGVIDYKTTVEEYGTTDIDNLTRGLSTGLLTSLDINGSRAASYALSVSDRGFALVLKTDGKDDGKGVFWMAAQRLADAKTGETLIDGHSPVVCLTHQEWLDNEDAAKKLDYTTIVDVEYTLTREYQLNMIIIREKDVHAPTNTVTVYNNSNYINGIWNKEKQLAINDNEEYLIHIPDGINTHRHLYHNKRMDMIAFTSANIIMEDGIAELTMHNEPTKRKYLAQRSTIGYVEGSRMLMLIENGGV